MRTATAAPVTSLLGSLGLHAFAVLVLFLVVRNSAVQPDATRPRPDAWQGTAVEVDAIATPEATPNIANAADSPTESVANAAPAAAQEPTPLAHEPTTVAPASEPGEAPARPKPRPKQRPRPAPAPAVPAAGAESAAEPSTGSHAATTSAATGAFGSEGLPIGVRSLPSAFARAIPPATGADPIWQTLPVGSQRPFTLMIR